MSTFPRRFQDRAQITGYWQVIDSPVLTERLATLGYDYICLDNQHGDFVNIKNNLIALDAGSSISGRATAGIVRVPDHDGSSIGRVLDAGATGVIVPLINNATEASTVARACHYAPTGTRSYGPLRSQLRIGPAPRVADREVLCIVMVETRAGLDNVRDILAVEGVDGVYIGPVDLALSLGGADYDDPNVLAEWEAAIAVILSTAAEANKPVGIHTENAHEAAARLKQGFSFVSIAAVLDHIADTAAAYLAHLRD